MDMPERWVKEHQSVVYRAACLILRDPQAAEEVAQETFILAARAARRPTSEAEVRPWLYRIGVNLSLTKLRSRQREGRAMERMASLQQSASGDELLDHRMRRLAVIEALNRLPERLRVPVILKYYLDLSEEEIAKSMQIRKGTVKSRLHAARHALADDDAIAMVERAG